MWTLILGSLFRLVPLAIRFLFPLAWLLGWRSGALTGSALLVLIGLGLNLDSRDFSVFGLFLGPLLDLHFLLIGLLLWEWGHARNHRHIEPLNF